MEWMLSCIITDLVDDAQALRFESMRLNITLEFNSMGKIIYVAYPGPDRLLLVRKMISNGVDWDIHTHLTQNWIENIEHWLTGWINHIYCFIGFVRIHSIEIELELKIWDHGQVMDTDANFNYILFLPFSEAFDLPFTGLGAGLGARLRRFEIEIGPWWPWAGGPMEASIGALTGAGSGCSW